MDKEFGLVGNRKKLFDYIKFTLIILLVVMEVVIIAQYATTDMREGAVPQLIAVIMCCFVLAVLECISSFTLTNFVAKLTVFGFDSALLLVICLLTGNSYLAALYCIVLTQYYITVDSLKKNSIIFGVSCGLYLISFIVGWVVLNNNVEFWQGLARILGDVIFGLVVLAIHFVVTNFILKFYSNYVKLRVALKEADERKAQLKEAYEQLSETAVYEERNRIAKDIHDNAGHSMTTVIMQTEAAKLLIDSNPEEAKSRIISANIQAKNALEQMRESVHLFAGRQQTRTLKEEIEGIIAQTIDGTELKIRYDLEDVPAGTGEHRFICNSVKECLVNGIKHGKATAFYVEMKKSGEMLNVLISDNGSGAPEGFSEGFGLKGIRQKAEAFGGSCSFSCAEDEGFEVEISLPSGGKSEDDK